MCIPYGRYQGNRSEYLAIPALSKLGFTVVVPRQEDHFGIDFIVHLAKTINSVVTPTGKAFGIQIKSNKDPLAFDTQAARDSLFGSSLPFFLGVVNREDLTLTVYNTLNRLNFFWMLGPTRDFTLIVGDEGNGVPKPDFERRTGSTGKPILEIGISEPATPRSRLDEIEILRSTMRSWVNLENKNLSLKEQGIALLFWPSTYGTNKPLEEGIGLKTHSYTKFAGPDSLHHVCRATEEALTSLSFYLRKLPQDSMPTDSVSLTGGIDVNAVELLKTQCERLRVAHQAQRHVDAMTSATHSYTTPDHPGLPGVRT